MTEVACGNQTFLFSRREARGDHKTFETLVRTRRMDGSYSMPAVGLGSQSLMSHNLAVLCVEGGTLLAYGGMAHLPTSEDWQGHDIGIVARAADASRLPLQWGPERLIRSGDKTSTGCIDELNHPCEYDGKLSAVKYRGGVMLFTRSNLAARGGARHVQVTRSRDGLSGWSRFEQLKLGSVGAARPGEIYFFTVRRIALQQRGARMGGARGGLLLGLFPGVVDGESGIFMTTSADRAGVVWSQPTLLIASPNVGHGRTRDYPVDGMLHVAMPLPHSTKAGRGVASDLEATGEDSLRLVVEHQVDLRDYTSASMDTGCFTIGRPYLCSYLLPKASILAGAVAAGP